jgi:hypothetical protein
LFPAIRIEKKLGPKFSGSLASAEICQKPEIEKKTGM